MLPYTHMKKLLTTTLILTFFFLPLTFSFAQTNEPDLELEENIETNISDSQEQEDDNGGQEETQEDTQDESESLADSLEQEKIEQIQPQTRSFWTILGAILIPSIFIIIAYLILKSFQT
jgi:hypothetical protein